MARNLLSAANSRPAARRVARAALVQQALTMPFEAPRSMFNVPIGGARLCGPILAAGAHQAGEEGDRFDRQ
jgi:hypothetical protein